MNMLKLATSGILGTLTVNGFIEREMNNHVIDTIEPVDTVSIIVPAFNEEPFIKKSLSSIRGQSIINEFPEYYEPMGAGGSGASNNQTGSRGGARVIYFHRPSARQILLLDLYAKNEKSDLSAQEVKILKQKVKS